MSRIFSATARSAGSSAARGSGVCSLATAGLVGAAGASFGEAAASLVSAVPALGAASLADSAAAPAMAAASLGLPAVALGAACAAVSATCCAAGAIAVGAPAGAPASCAMAPIGAARIRARAVLAKRRSKRGPLIWTFSQFRRPLVTGEAPRSDQLRHPNAKAGLDSRLEQLVAREFGQFWRAVTCLQPALQFFSRRV